MTYRETVDAVLRDSRRLPSGAPVFKATAPPATEAELTAAEARLGLTLPLSYRWFATHAGAGEWCGEYVPRPDELYPFDADVGAEMEGMVALVWNADGTGDYVAFAPDTDQAADPPLDLCSHDPFGRNRAAASFGEWLVARLAAEERGEYFYGAAYTEMDRKLAEERAKQRSGKKFWEFWR